MTKNLIHILLISAALAISALACGSDSDDSKTVTGQVVDVQAVSLEAFSSLTVRDEDGREWTFKGGLFTGFTPSHLVAHRAENAPVVVTYRENADGSLTALKLEDG